MLCDSRKKLRNLCHTALGPGFVEKIYEKAFAYELKKETINFEHQKTIRVEYANLELGDQRVDFLIEDEMIVDIKSVSRIIELHQDQMISYLKTSNKRLGLILNFGRKKIEIRRLVNNF
ncbi:MAG: GxxExxY protein [Candidatus Edwardsbacteria bacterium]